MSSFVIYDLETGGLDSRLDRTMQFAGIRVDENLNILGDPLVLYCKLPSFYIPQKSAIEVTGITSEECQEKGLPEYIFAQQINKFFTQQNNTVVMGFNNIKFDEEFTRNLFYRNFLPPYDYSFKDGNSRWDLINLVRATYELRPEGINWTFKEDGTPTFKLELLTKANGISHENAHDALSDVMATLEMLRLIKNKQPQLFNYALNLRLTKQVQSLISTVDYLDEKPAVYIDGSGVHLLSTVYFSSEKGRVFFDLTAQNDEELELKKQSIDLFINSNSETLSFLIFKTQLEEQEQKPPLKIIRDNSCPFYCSSRLLQKNERNNILLKNYQILLDYLKTKAEISEISNKVSEILKLIHFEKSDFVEQQLYEGFFSQEETVFRSRANFILQNKDVDVQDLLDLFEDFKILKNSNQRHQDLFNLFIATHFLDKLPSNLKEELEFKIIKPRQEFYQERLP